MSVNCAAKVSTAIMGESAEQRHEVAILELPNFGSVEAERILAEDNLFAVIRDKYPVSPGHSLIVVKRAVS